MHTMTDHNLAQATLLIAALRAKLVGIVPCSSVSWRRSQHCDARGATSDP